MSGREHQAVTFNEPHAGSRESAARFIAYASPYVFWVVVSALCGGIWVVGGS